MTDDAATPAALPFFRGGPILSIGECMVELARNTDTTFQLAYGGDTFNTAVYLARALIEHRKVGYVTALGTDPYSDAIAELAATEAVDPTLSPRIAGRMPGLYLIETDAGERTFWYWRERAPVRDLFAHIERPKLHAACERAALIYLSGITLSLFDADALDQLHAVLQRAKHAGARVAMDSNYRPRGWPGERAATQATFERFWRLADVALPTFDDEAALWDDASWDDTRVRIQGYGVGEIVIKGGQDGALCISVGTLNARADTATELGTTVEIVPCPNVVEPRDTTAAGDSFNAGYLAARLLGLDQLSAADQAHRLAAIVITHRGAIVPKSATHPWVEALQAATHGRST